MEEYIEPLQEPHDPPSPGNNDAILGENHSLMNPPLDRYNPLNMQ